MIDSVGFSSKLHLGYDENSGLVKGLVGQEEHSILHATTEALEAKLTIPQKQLDRVTARQQALAEVQLAVKKLMDTTKPLSGADILRTANNSGVFSYTTAFLGKVNGMDGGDFVSITNDPGVMPTNVQLAINRTASRDSLIASVGVANKNDALGLDCSVTMPLIDDADETVTLSISADMSASQINSALNARTAETGLRSALVPSGDGFKIRFEGVNLAQTLNFTVMDNGGADIGVLPTARTADETSSQAELLKAEIIYQGETSTYNSNTIKIDGVNFNLLQATPVDDDGNVGVISVDITPDLSETYNFIEKWINAYNDLKDVIDRHTRLDINLDDEQGLLNADTPLLAGNALTAQIMTQLDDVILQTTNPYNDTVTNLANIGITLADNRLICDVPTLHKALQNNFAEVSNLFDFQAHSANHRFVVVDNPMYDCELPGQTVQLSLFTNADGEVVAEIDNGGVITAIASRYITAKDNHFVVQAPENSKFRGLRVFYNGSMATLPVDTELSLAHSIKESFISYSDTLYRDYEDMNNPSAFQLEQEKLLLLQDRKQKEIAKIKSHNVAEIQMLEEKLQATQHTRAALEKILVQVRSWEKSMSSK